MTLKLSKTTLLASMLVFLLGISGCTSTPSRIESAGPTLGIVYYRSERPDEYTIGGFYYYDFNTHLVHPLTSNNVDGYTKGIGWAPVTRQFVYAAGDLSQAEIYTTDIDGQKNKRLTSNAREDTKPSWSPNGEKIAYVSRKEDLSEPHIYVMNADGTELHQLLGDARIMGLGTPVWSPHGQSVAVLGQSIDQPPYDKSVNIYVVDAKSGEITYQLADGTVHLRIAWSPDGQQLAFAGSRDGLSGLFIWSLSDGKVKRITDVKDVLNVDWSPDGRHLSFQAGLLQEEVHLYMIQPDGQNLKNLTPDLTYATSDGVGTWSPDSRCLVFSAFPKLSTSAPVSDIYVLDTQTGSKIKITNDRTYYAAGSWVWSLGDNPSCESIFQNK